ncbi:MAG: hypothetical protein HY327_10320 [Chloroflexi bacterium]|nr:hypothetical protein [Chloroflexota bacterium]
MRLNEEQRKLWADKLMDLANIATAALVFGQFLSGTGFQYPLFMAGVAIYVVLWIWAMVLRR